MRLRLDQIIQPARSRLSRACSAHTQNAKIPSSIKTGFSLLLFSLLFWSAVFIIIIIIRCCCLKSQNFAGRLAQRGEKTTSQTETPCMHRSGVCFVEVHLFKPSYRQQPIACRACQLCPFIIRYIMDTNNRSAIRRRSDRNIRSSRNQTTKCPAIHGHSSMALR